MLIRKFEVCLVTAMFQKYNGFMNRTSRISWFNLWMSLFLLLTFPMIGAAQITTGRPAIERGFLAAQACEAEIDDDLDQYRECIRHVIDRMRANRDDGGRFFDLLHV